MLTTDPAPDLFVACDASDDRRVIENPCNREAKERGVLEPQPTRSEAGVWAHASFVFMGLALVTAFRQSRQQSEEAERSGDDTGISRSRSQLKAANRDTVSVFCGPHFGIFRNDDFAMRLGATGRDRALMGESVQTVLERDGARKADTS